MNSLELTDQESWTDRDCIESSRNGSPEHFRVLVERYQGPLTAYLTGRLGNRKEAEEAAQETFVRAFFGLEKLREPDAFNGWLLGIAARVAKERFRLWRHWRRDREAAAAMSAAASGPREAGQLEPAIAALPENYRRVILLRYYEGLPCREIAARLDMALGTATKMLSRAHDLLRRELRSRGEASPLNEEEERP